MKIFWIGLIPLVGLAFSTYSPLSVSPKISTAANGPAFASSLPKFEVNDPQIVWAAPTNQSRAALWIYHVVPQHFPVAAISNLMARGCFTNTITATTNPLYFANASNTCSLVVQPSQGWIRYSDYYAPPNHWDRTNHLWEQVAGLPDEAKAEKLGLKFLKQFGIGRSDIAQKANGHLITFGTEEKRSYFDRRRGKNIDDEVFARGIYFNRRIDGVNFAGIGIGGGCEIMYGTEAKIADFKLVWRNLQPYEHRQVASPDEIMQWIRGGRAVMTHKNLVNPVEVRKLIITESSLLYMGADGEEKQDFVYPFVQIEAVADLGGTNVNVQLYCPILTTNTVTTAGRIDFQRNK